LDNYFAEKLSEAGIPSLVKVEKSPDPAPMFRFGHGWLYGIYVRTEDEIRARELDEECWNSLFEEEMKPVDLEKVNDQLCPACGAWAGIGAQECPSCGLFLGSK
jgi:hypothetical protein